jgi:threonine dehydrogenase-like Zn-dependent dehydrogenase
MKALCWHRTNDIRCDSVPDPKTEDGRDVIIKVTSCAICGSDLHLMGDLMPTMKSGDILGHEFIGEVVETGSAHSKFRKGDRIIVPFNINCGECRQCRLGNIPCASDPIAMRPWRPSSSATQPPAYLALLGLWPRARPLPRGGRRSIRFCYSERIH